MECMVKQAILCYKVGWLAGIYYNNVGGGGGGGCNGCKDALNTGPLVC